MRNMKVRTKLLIVMFVAIAVLALCVVFSTNSMAQMQNQALEIIENDERESYDELIKQQVENVISLCQVIYDKYQAGEYTEDEAKKIAADEIRAFLG